MAQNEEKKTLQDLVVIADRLRGPGGCPWDREQTLESLRAYVLEEAYEVIQAIELQDTEGLVEELGDFLFQVVFISQIASEEDKFNIDDVIKGICEKLVRRHPHVFGEKKAKDTEEALKTWNAEKMKEKNGKLPIDEVPRSMPSLMRAQRIGEKASRVGFDWESSSSALSKVKEELLELEREVESGELEKITEEWGDLVFSMANLARHLGIDAETASHAASGKFIKRFSRLKTLLGDREILRMPSQQIDKIWEEAKKSTL